ncbi:MAG: tetratricopeptide repeat protein [Bacteroidetes bacterium]|nr:tetratricopeptide repeat protein [Bacteroidota bacterium]
MKILIPFLLLFFTTHSIGQNSYADSLILYANQTEGVKKAQVLEDISIEYRFADPYLSLTYGEKALAQARFCGDSVEVGNSFNCIGIANHIQGKYELALSFYLKALKEFEEKKEPKGVASTNLNIGIVYADRGMYDLSLKHYKQALKLYESGAGDKRSIANAINNIATIYSNLNKYSDALAYQYKALKIRNDLNDSSGIATSLMNIGNIYLGMNHAEKSLNYYLQSLEIERILGNDRNVALTLSNIGEVYFQLKDYKNAIKISEECIQISKKMDFKPQLKQAYQVLSESYKDLKQFEKALDYHELYANIKDSIFSEESASSIAEMQTKYDTEKKDAENHLLKQETEIKNLQLSKNKTWIIILFLGLALIAVSALLLFNRYQIKKKDNKELEQKNMEITFQKKEMTDSINYAKKIQNAILPSEQMVAEALTDRFVLYKPKDIVSGDFYWLEKKDDVVLFAAVDCTGHGVPGAMMSMLGLNLLSQAVNEKGLIQPAAILKHLDVGIYQSLRKTSEENAMKDGMDLSLCALNLKTHELQYSGAYNPVWIVKSGTNEMIEIKADKKPIGANSSGEEGVYKNHTIQLEKGDCIYLFTDGFADQFGGKKGKKFMYRPLKEILISVSQKSMQNQLNALSNALYSWQGDHDQVDDILIIGVRV